MYELVKNLTSATVSVGGLLPKTNAILPSSVAVAASAGAISTYNGVVAASAFAYDGLAIATNYAAEKAANVSPETRKKIIYGTAIVAGTGAAIVVAPIAIGAIGFTSGGVAPGSVAASIMSTGATMTGGATPAGGLIATLQSVGAVGSVLGSTGATVTAASTGATMGVGAAYSAEKLLRK